MKQRVIRVALTAALGVTGCQGSTSGTSSAGLPRTPVPANARLLFHGPLHGDINLDNFPPGGTGRIYVYDSTTGQLQATLNAENGAHFDAASLPAGHEVKVFFVPKAAQ